jgi:hypothetical protein
MCLDTGAGRCRLGHPVSSLAEVTARRLYEAGISADDPGLAWIRTWNDSVTGKPAATPDTPSRRVNGESPRPLREHGPDLFPAHVKESPRQNESAPQMGSASQLNPTGTSSQGRQTNKLQDPAHRTGASRPRPLATGDDDSIPSFG